MGQTTKTSKFPKAEKETDALLEKDMFSPDFILVPRQRYVGSRFFTVLFCKSPAARVAKKKETLARRSYQRVKYSWFARLGECGLQKVQSHVDCERGKILFKLLLPIFRRNLFVDFEWKTLCSTSQKLENFSLRSPFTWRVKGVVIPLISLFTLQLTLPGLERWRTQSLSMV